MSLRNLLWFWRRRIRARIVQESFAIVGIAVGVALLFAVQVSSTSLSASIAQLSHGLVGNAQLQLVARDPQGFDARIVARAAATPGVEAAAPVLQAVRGSSQPVGVRPRRLRHSPPRGSRSIHACPNRRLTCRPLASRHFASKYAPSPDFDGTITMAGATVDMDKTLARQDAGSTTKFDGSTSPTREYQREYQNA